MKPLQARQPIKLNSHDRWFFVGRTGSGKSFLIKYLAGIYVRAGGRVAIVDGPDHGWCDKQHPPATKGEGTVLCPRVVKRFAPNLRVQMYQPSVPGYADEGLMRFVEDIFNEKNTLIIFDEIFGILDPNHQPVIITQVWTQGRKHNVPAWAASQRPSRVPEVIMSQADNWGIFQLLNEQDKKKIAEWTNSPEIVDTRLPRRAWFFFNADLDHVQLMNPVKAVSQ